MPLPQAQPSRTVLGALLLTLAWIATPVAASDHAVSDEAIQAMEWRLVGPYRGGRSAAVAGIPQNRETYYFGGTGGGVWKTDDAGTTWTNLNDGNLGRYAQSPALQARKNSRVRARQRALLICVPGEWMPRSKQHDAAT